MSTLISWCLDCGADAEFDHIPDGPDADYFLHSHGAAWVDYLCRTCGAAVVVAESALDESPGPSASVRAVA